MPQQRPFFLSSFLAAFRAQGPSLPSSQANKHATTAAAASSASHHQAQAASHSTTTSGANPTTSAAFQQAQQQQQQASRNPIPIPIPAPSRRRGSDSSTEGFREVIGADKFYIGGRTAAGDEKFFKLGVVRRVRSNDGLSLDRLSL